MSELPAVVIPAAADSPWVEQAVASVRAQGGVARVVSEGEFGGGLRCSVGAGFAERANLGLAAAANAGHERALLLNDDAVLEPGALQALAEALDDAAVVGGVVRDWEGPGIQQAGLRFSRRSGRVRACTELPREALERRQAVGGAALALRLAVWRELGGLDPSFHFYMEDLAFCLRAAHRGHHVVVARDALVRHRGGGTRSHHSPEAAWHLGRSHTLLAWAAGGTTWARGARVLGATGFGLAWSARSVGRRGPRAFLGGARDAAAAITRGQGAWELAS